MAWTKAGEAKSVALIGNAADVFPELVKRGGIKPDMVTDQTSAHDPIHGYLPLGLDGGPMAIQCRKAIPKRWKRPRVRQHEGASRCDGRFLERGRSNV